MYVFKGEGDGGQGVESVAVPVGKVLVSHVRRVKQVVVLMLLLIGLHSGSQTLELAL